MTSQLQPPSTKNTASLPAVAPAGVVVGERDPPGWDLFVDWCSATGVDPYTATVETIDAFDVAVPAVGRTRRNRAAAIRRVLGGAGTILPSSARWVESAWRVGPDWLTLPDALRRIPFAGWPGGFRGRRDAYLLVLLHGGFTRAEALSTTTGHVSVDADGVTIRGQLIEPDIEDLEACAVCAVTRWLRVASLENTWGRSSVRTALIAASTHPTSHDCVDPLPAKWREVWHLLPAIDRHGWPTDWRPMSSRAVSAVAAYRQLVRPQPVRAVPDMVGAGDDVADAVMETAAAEAADGLRDADLDDLFDVLDERIDAADEVLRRIDAQLADDAAVVAHWGVHDDMVDPS